MLNEITIMGRMVQTPELRVTPSGIETTTFTVACDRDMTEPDGNRPTDFIDVVAWRDTAKFISRYFQKGQMIIVTGRLQVRSWATKEGDKRKTKKYDLKKIYYPDKEGDIGTFEYKNETIEFIDFYEPSLYETLKEIKAESQE